MSLNKNVTSGAYVTQQYSNKRSLGFSFVIASINLIETATKYVVEKIFTNSLKYTTEVAVKQTIIPWKTTL